MTESILWLFFAVLFIACLGISIAIMVSDGYQAVNMPQLAYLVYIYLVLIAGIALQAVPGWLVGLCFLLTPPVAYGLGHRRRKNEIGLSRDLLSEELHRAENFLAEHPDDPFPLRQMAELYEKTGDLLLEMACYERLVAITENARVDHATFTSRLKSVQAVLKNPAVLSDSHYRTLRGCFFCGEINRWGDAACQRCGQALGSSAEMSWWRLWGNFFTEEIFVCVATGALLAIAFRLPCGAAASRALWFISSLTLWLWRTSARRKAP